MKLVNSLKMSEIDAFSSKKFGIPPIVLMENAGIRLWDQFCHSYVSDDYSPLNLVFLCGNGNNGGDGMVMARQAWNDGFYNISIILSKDPEIAKFSESCRTNFDICLALGIPYFTYNDGVSEVCLAEGDVIFDCLCGTGIKGPLNDYYAEIVRDVNLAGAEVIAIDVPSGLGDAYKTGFPSIKADRTYTLALPKESLYRPSSRPFCGDITVVQIGFPESLKQDVDITSELGDWDEAVLSAPSIKEDAYKNSRGHIGVYAGARGTLGAALLSAKGAGRSRAGLVSLYLDEDLYGVAAALGEGVMICPLEDSIDFSRFNALLVGPGWGIKGREPLLFKLFESGLPGILDADGLRVWADSSRLSPKVPWIFTPHPGEMEKLTGVPSNELLDDPYPHCLALARETSSVICFKSHVLWIVGPDGRSKVVDGMNPALGTGGSGDILAGILAGLLASGMDAFDAAWIGASFHQEAGQRCRQSKGWFLAEDLLPTISQLSEELGSRFE